MELHEIDSQNTPLDLSNKVIGDPSLSAQMWTMARAGGTMDAAPKAGEPGAKQMNDAAEQRAIEVINDKVQGTLNLNTKDTSDHLLNDWTRYKFTPQQSQVDVSGSQAPLFIEEKLGNAGERMWSVTRDGISKIPEGFQKSLTFDNAASNVAIGITIGAASRALLPLTGPFGKGAAFGTSAYFIGKPLVESYTMALSAQTQADMNRASSHLGDAVGGMPVAFAEGMVGAKIGSSLAGRALALPAAKPFVDWKARQYDKLDRLMNGEPPAPQFHIKPPEFRRPSEFDNAVSVTPGFGKTADIYRFPELNPKKFNFEPNKLRFDPDKIQMRQITVNHKLPPFIGVPDTRPERK
jgi:hypothetical protein